MATYTPPTGSIIHELDLMLDHYDFPPTVDLTQYDAKVPILKIQLWSHANPYTIPSTAKVNVRMRKPDDKAVYDPMLGTDASDNSIIYIAVTAQMTAAAGDAIAIVEITNDTGVLGSGRMRLHIAENPVVADHYESSDEYKTLDDLIKEAQTASDAAKNSQAEAKKSEMAAAKSADTASSQAQAAKGSADAAATSQKKAADNEANATASAKSAKDAQTAAETAQRNAETAQSAAENWSNKSQSWAVGTGDISRQDQATDNSKYYASQAAKNATQAGTEAGRAETARTGAEAAKSEAEKARDAAKNSATAAAGSASVAKSEAQSALDSASLAETAKNAATTAQQNAESAQSKAEDAKNKAAASAADAKESARKAEDAYAAIEAMPEPMIFKGSLGTGGTITALPAAAAANTGFTYKVITAGTYAEQKAKVGDTFISDGKSWILIPSGDEPSGTVTSVAIKATSPIAVDNDAAVTTSGTRTISHAASGVTAAAKGDTTNQAPAFGGTFKVPSGTVNATGHLTVFADHTVTIPSATATGDAPGLMSAADKKKLDGIAGGATASKLYGSTGTATDGAMTQKATTDALAGKAAAEHTHTAEEVGAAAASHNHDSVYVKKAGDTVTGTLVLSKTTDASGTANNSPALIVGGTADTAHIEIDANEILAKSNGTTPEQLNLNTEGGLVNMGGNVTVGGSITTSGDLTLKGAEQHIRHNDGAEGGFNGAAISFYKGDQNGAGVVIGAGGRTIIGGGEAARNLRTELNKGSTTDSSELTYIASDGEVIIDTYCQPIANRKQFTFQKDGRLSGVAAPTADTDAANKKYVDDRVTAAAGSGGGVAGGVADSVAHNLIAGDKTYNGSADVTLTAADVGALAVDGKAKSAAAADAVPWSGVTGKPTISVSEETLIFQ